jgi:aspartate aminotransferase
MADGTTLAARIGAIEISATARVAAAADQLRRQGVEVVDLGVGEPDFPTPENVKQAGIRAIEQNFTRYTSTGGIPELKAAICARHAADFGTRYASEECIVSVGGKHVIFNYTQVLLGPGDEVVIPVPYWVTYKDVVEYAGARCVFADGFAGIAAAITSRTKMVIVNSPCNPSGAVLGREPFERILRLTSRRGIWLLTDESYCRFVYDGEPFSIAAADDAHATVLVSGSVSKTYAMTGWRIGFGLAPAPVVSAMVKLQSHTTTNPASVAQMAALEAVRGPQESVAMMLAEYRRRRDYIVERLRAMPGVSLDTPAGAFYAYPNIRAVLTRIAIPDVTEFARRLLDEQRLAVVPGSAFGTGDQIRISYAAAPRELERGMDRLNRFLTEHSR